MEVCLWQWLTMSQHGHVFTPKQAKANVGDIISVFRLSSSVALFGLQCNPTNGLHLTQDSTSILVPIESLVPRSDGLASRSNTQTAARRASIAASFRRKLSPMMSGLSRLDLAKQQQSTLTVQ